MPEKPDQRPTPAAAAPVAAPAGAVALSAHALAAPQGMAPIAIFTTTVDSAEAAQRLAQGAVQAQLAACAQVEGITSHYIWQGRMQAGAEWRVVLKTTPAAHAALQVWLGQHHPYDVPQLLLRAEWASVAYAEWVAQQVSSAAATASAVPMLDALSAPA